MRISNQPEVLLIDRFCRACAGHRGSQHLPAFPDEEGCPAQVIYELIGRLDPVSGKTVPTDGRCRHLSAVRSGAEPLTEPPQPPAETVSAAPRALSIRHLQSAPGYLRKTTVLHYGGCGALERISIRTGAAADLTACLGEQRARELLSLSYYIALSDKPVISSFSRWAASHPHPCGHEISSQRSSELFASITQEQITRFCALQARRHQGDEYLAFDTTSIPSYAQSLRQVRQGRNNREGVIRPLLNLVLLFALVSSAIDGAESALRTCRARNVAEQAFGNFRDSLCLDRLRASTGILSAARNSPVLWPLLHLSYIKKQMEDHLPFRDYTIRELLWTLDAIPCFVQPGHEPRTGAVLNRQKELTEMLELEPF